MELKLLIRAIRNMHQIIETAECIFIVTEFLEGGELFNHIVKQKRLSEEEAKRFYQQLLSGIEHIHAIGVVHRDIKPENLILDQGKKLKIVDFGLSNTFDAPQRLKTACGSPCYAPPEMIENKWYDPTKTDIWSSGVVLYAMVCGFLPFQVIFGRSSSENGISQTFGMTVS